MGPKQPTARGCTKWLVWAGSRNKVMLRFCADSIKGTVTCELSIIEEEARLRWSEHASGNVQSRCLKDITIWQATFWHCGACLEVHYSVGHLSFSSLWIWDEVAELVALTQLIMVANLWPGPCCASLSRMRSVETSFMHIKDAVELLQMFIFLENEKQFFVVSVHCFSCGTVDPNHG